MALNNTHPSCKPLSTQQTHALKQAQHCPTHHFGVDMNEASFLAAAEQHCLQGGVKLTDLRRKVLSLAVKYTGIVKAYQLLTDLQAERGGVAPPTIYRALDFLVEQGLLHRIEALNGFLVCQHFNCTHHGLILSCQRCGKATEINDDEHLPRINAHCQNLDFVMRKQSIVIDGWCASCTPQAI